MTEILGYITEKFGHSLSDWIKRFRINSAHLHGAQFRDEALVAPDAFHIRRSRCHCEGAHNRSRYKMWL